MRPCCRRSWRRLGTRPTPQASGTWGTPSGSTPPHSAGSSPSSASMAAARTTSPTRPAQASTCATTPRRPAARGAPRWRRSGRGSTARIFSPSGRWTSWSTTMCPSPYSCTWRTRLFMLRLRSPRPTATPTTPPSTTPCAAPSRACSAAWTRESVTSPRLCELSTCWTTLLSCSPRTTGGRFPLRVGETTPGRTTTRCAGGSTRSGRAEPEGQRWHGQVPTPASSQPASAAAPPPSSCTARTGSPPSAPSPARTAPASPWTA
mmetsp:Transcript_21291/g.54354  ORF Transcript_21291/g.54354 Transcript_21291/m.54354 type:complete len:262 (+) Transcript_21291:303-1088(+)